ncbi:response regulator transcription factor [Leptothoe sp. PORK10 BA2]|uniref:response regulator transcription factor n=1 Tax=Leptothoe sp. PORK10 BA2 TaxID=3110254 RepID=UPI002B208D4B|nr:LuxR C-terminal-related transcriptional regulator [Leptothoe sp. PORK10 BA2]MEA5463911.1 LuxR C-terminal-related transcriptional regulator [Leptothoe sp. PORK10 BA2]
MTQSVQLTSSSIPKTFDRQSSIKTIAAKTIVAKQISSSEIAYTPLRIVTQFSANKGHFYIIALSFKVVADLSDTEYQQQLIEMISRLFYLEKLEQEQINSKVSVIDSFELASERYCIVQVISQPASSSCAVSVTNMAEQILSSTEYTCDRETLSDLLTPREQEIICLIAVGLSNKQISKYLDISIWTVSAHLRRIFAKLKVDTRAAVVYQCSTLIQDWQKRVTQRSVGHEKGVPLQKMP